MVKKDDEMTLDINEAEMEEAVEELMKREAKREAQRWAHVFDVRPKIEDVFAAMSKSELTERRKMLRLKNAGALNKNELAKAVAAAVLERAEVLFELIEIEQYEWLAELSEADGVVNVEEEDLSALEWLYSIGWISFGHVANRRSVVMSQELMEVFRKVDGKGLRALAEQNSQWIILASGLAYYYGVLSSQEMLDALNHLTGEEIDEDRLKAVIAINAAEGAWSIAFEDDWFFDFRVWDHETTRLEQDEYEALTAYPFTYEQIYEAGQIDFIERNAAVDKLLQLLLKEWQCDDEEAKARLDDWLTLLKNGDGITEVIEIIEDSLGFPTKKLAKKTVDLLVELNNSTRRWALKGHTPQEIHQLSQPGSNVVLLHRPNGGDTVGPNDPCPCGSGKKYKKCCAEKSRD